MSKEYLEISNVTPDEVDEVIVDISVLDEHVVVFRKNGDDYFLAGCVDVTQTVEDLIREFGTGPIEFWGAEQVIFTTYDPDSIEYQNRRPPYQITDLKKQLNGVCFVAFT